MDKLTGIILADKHSENNRAMWNDAPVKEPQLRWSSDLCGYAAAYK